MRVPEAGLGLLEFAHPPHAVLHVTAARADQRRVLVGAAAHARAAAAVGQAAGARAEAAAEDGAEEEGAEEEEAEEAADDEAGDGAWRQWSGHDRARVRIGVHAHIEWDRFDAYVVS